MKTTIRQVYPSFSVETLEETGTARRFNPALVATFKGKRFVLSAGNSDSLTFYSDAPSNTLYCLSQNSRLGYIGCEAFNTLPLEHSETHEKSEQSPSGYKRRETTKARQNCGSVFYQNANEEMQRDDMESDLFDLSDRAIFGLVRDYCDL